MNPAAWSCVECDTNNGAGADECRNCAAPRTFAGGAVREQPVRRTQQRTEQPVFVESRYAASTEPPAPARVRLGGSGPLVPGRPPAVPPPVVPTPHPVRERPSGPIRSKPAPAPPPRPVYHRPSGGRRIARRVGKWALIVVAGMFLLGNLDDIADLLPDLGGAPDAAPATPCPPEAAQGLPGGGSDAVLEVAYTTPRHVITLCRTAAGELYYDGRYWDSAEHISVPAQPTSTGYIATNGGYRYEISGAEVIITKPGGEVVTAPLTRTGP